MFRVVPFLEQTEEQLEEALNTTLRLPLHVGELPIHHGQRWGSGYRRTEADIRTARSTPAELKLRPRI